MKTTYCSTCQSTVKVIHDFGEYYTARVLSGSKDMHDSVIAVCKKDCEKLHLGDYASKRPVTMKT